MPLASRLLIVTGMGSFVEPTSYGAALDCTGVYDAVVAGGDLNTVTSATAAFTAADDGKTFTLASTAGAVTTGTLTYVNSTTCDMSVSAAAGMTGARLIYGTDDTGAWQAALNAALPGQVVDCESAAWRSLCTGQLTVPEGVRLGLVGRGPFDPQTNPAMNDWGPTFVVVQDASTAFVTLNTGSGLGDFMFYSANQVPPTAATATSFAPFVTMDSGSVAGCRIGSPYFANAYHGIAVMGGRHHIDKPQIGALYRGLTIDWSQDTVSIGRVHCSPYWRICEGQTYTPTAATLDDYALDNAWAFMAYRADSFNAEEVFSFGLYGGVAAVDSADEQGVECGYGLIGMLDADTVAYGIYASATNTPGLLVSQAMIGANSTGVGTAGQAGVATVGGGSLAPKVVVSSWSVRGTFASGNSSAAGGTTLRVPSNNPG